MVYTVFYFFVEDLLLMSSHLGQNFMACNVSNNLPVAVVKNLLQLSVTWQCTKLQTWRPLYFHTLQAQSPATITGSHTLCTLQTVTWFCGLSCRMWNKTQAAKCVTWSTCCAVWLQLSWTAAYVQLSHWACNFTLELASYQHFVRHCKPLSSYSAHCWMR